MPAFIDLTGKRFHRWTVIRQSKKLGSKLFWECRCDCGSKRRVAGGNLRSGLTKSCGCWNLERVKQKTHGMIKSPEYRTWSQMKDRCSNTNSKSFARYGGRGIKVCNRWLDSFEDFYEDMGPRPKGTSIERRDNSGNYTPLNCHWGTNQEQSRNKRNNRVIAFLGRKMILTDWASALSMSPSLLHYHLAHGKSIQSIYLERSRQ